MTAGRKHDLYRLVSRVCEVPQGEPAQALVDRLQELLEAGVDPNTTTTFGLTGLHAIPKVQPHTDFAQLRRALRLLMQHGADPWRQSAQGHGLSSPIAMMTKGTAFQSDTRDQFILLAEVLFAELQAQEDRGVLHENPHGDNPLHATCKFATSLVPHMFQVQKVSQQWVVGSNDMGHTPMHVLWQPGERMRQARDPHLSDLVNGRFWEATAALLQHGADLHAPDRQGITPHQLIQAQLQQGMPASGPAWPIVDAYLQGSALDHTVAKASASINTTADTTPPPRPHTPRL